MASYWKIIVPEATTNLITNPSFETGTTGWTTGGTNAIAQSATVQTAGVYALKCTYSNNDVLASYAITLTAAAHTAGVDLYIPSTYTGTNLTFKFVSFVGMTGETSVSADMTLTDQWQRIDLTGTAVGGDLVGTIELQESGTNGAAAEFVYIDAVQCELKAYVTTYCDGSLAGCTWAGVAHASTSTRDALEASGGRVVDMSDDLGFIVAEQDGTGMPPVNNLSSALALRPGDLFEAQTIAYRSIILNGSIVGSTPTDFHQKKQELISALNPSTVRINQRSQPRTFRYTGAPVDKEIAAVYDGGLERGLPLGWSEMDISMRLKADDPLFYQLGNSGAVLDSSDTLAVRYIVRQNGSTGAWDNMGVTSTGGTIRAIASDPTYIYVSGDFTTINGIANTAYIARCDRVTGAWSAMGTGLNAACYALSVVYTGSVFEVWAGGSFTTAGGGAANYIAKWNMLSSTWSAIGTGLSGGSTICTALAYDSYTGVTYVGGVFTTAGGVAAANVAYYDSFGTTWAALGAGVNGQCLAIKRAPGGSQHYFGGLFTTAGGSSANGIAKWSGVAWSALGTGLTSNVHCEDIIIDSDGALYACGNFTLAGGISANYVAKWSGSTWSALGSGMNSVCREMVIDGSGTLYITGSFTTAGGSPANYAAKWNGSVWLALDINIPNTGYSLHIDSDDNMYIGFSNTGNALLPGTITIPYTGTYNAYPVISITRSGGTSAALNAISNTLTGATLTFNYALGSGETLTIDTSPGRQSITSSTSGNVYSALDPSSDFGAFFIMPGNDGSQDNPISCFVATVGSPTITALMTYKVAYISED